MRIFPLFPFHDFHALLISPIVCCPCVFPSLGVSTHGGLLDGRGLRVEVGGEDWDWDWDWVEDIGM